MAFNEYAGRGVEIGKVHVPQGETYEKAKMAEDARKQWLKEIDVFEEIGREDFVAIALDELGKTQLNGSEWSDAETTFEKLLRILKDKYPHYKASIANAKRSLGNACWELGERDEDEGKRDKAIGLYEEALEAYESLENEATEGFDKGREQQKIEKRLAEMRTARTSANKKKATSMSFFSSIYHEHTPSNKEEDTEEEEEEERGEKKTGDEGDELQNQRTEVSN